VIVGTLFADCPGDIFLIHSEVLDRVSHTTIATLFASAMKLLWKDEVKQYRIPILITDIAPYMLKAAKGLKMLKIPKNGPLHMSCALASTEWQKKSEETILMLTV
jgi:hypothetical protein